MNFLVFGFGHSVVSATRWYITLVLYLILGLVLGIELVLDLGAGSLSILL
jgi:hypothetical protein